MSQLFNTDIQTEISKGKLDNRLDSSGVLFVVFILGERLTRLTLTEKHPTVQVGEDLFEAKEGAVFVNDHPLENGLTNFGELKLFVVPSTKMETKYVLFTYKGFTISNHEGSAIQIGGDSLVNLNLNKKQNKVTIYKNEDPVYLNDVAIHQDIAYVDDFEVGFRIFTPDFYLERRSKQWKLTRFTEEWTIHHPEMIFNQGELKEFPVDFPNYRRSPRLILEAPTEQINVEKIGAEPELQKQSWVTTILPPIATLALGGAASLAMGRNPMLLLASGGLSVIMAIGTLSQQFTGKKGIKQKKIVREEKYENYLMGVTSRIAKRYGEETKILDYQHPAPETLAQLTLSYDSRIYERMNNNKDFLEVSLGTSEQATALKINYPNEEQEQDPEVLHVQKIMSQFVTQKKAPTKLEVFNQTLGLVGTYEVLKTQVANLLFQLAFFQSYHNVNFISLVPEKEYKKDWSKWRFLPHIMLQELGMRGIIHDAKSRDLVLNSFYRKLAERKEELKKAGRDKIQFSPYYVLIIFDDSYLSGHGINEILAEDTSELGMTVIWCKEDQRLLPETVTALVNYSNSSAGEIVNDHKLHVSTPFYPYQEVPDLEKALRRLANLNHVEVEKNSIPSSVTFLEMYKVKKVEALGIGQRWKRSNPSKSLAVPIGLRGKDDLEILNLHERGDGPHGIFGGTTGAGKSEMAQSLLLSLAVNFAPEDVSFLIIDFKGGGMSALFRNLPHLTGEITNLDGAGVQRAITAYQAEISKRQRYFDQFGVNNINDYTRLYKQGKETPDATKYPTEPLPHLIIVGDETAELKQQALEFLEVLVSGARVGRSLGIHQFLGTQSPAGVISEQIWDNSKFKLSLRMADEAASKSILKTPDAAFLSASEPGRAYLKVGVGERYELFQSAYSAADYDPDKEEVMLEKKDDRLWEINEIGQKNLLNQDLSETGESKKVVKEKYTELDAVVDYIAAYAKESHAIIPAKPWLPLLEERIVTPKVENTGVRNLSIPLGLMDIPSLQSQKPYNFDIEKVSHTAVFSSPGYGKSTTLLTIAMNLARQNTPEQVQFLLFDFGTNGLLPLRKLPHVIDITASDNTEKINKMLDLVRNELSKRKRLFAKSELANLKQYNAKFPNFPLPLQIILLDNYDTVAEGNEREKYDILLSQILREGAALGIYLILSANRIGSIRMGMLSNIQTKIALYMISKDEAANLFGRDRLEPQAILGRGQLLYQEVQAIQIYLPTQGDTEAQLYSALEKEIDDLDSGWKGTRPAPVPMVADEVKSQEFFENKQVRVAIQQNKLPIGYQKSNAKLFSINLSGEDYLGIIRDDKVRTQQLVRRLLDAYYELENKKSLVIFDTQKWLKDFEVPDSVIITDETIKSYLENHSLSDKFVLVVGAEDAFAGMTALDEAKKLLDEVAYLILISEPQWLTRMSDVPKYFKSNLRYGLLLKRLSEQTIISNPFSGREEPLLEDEAYAFRGKDVRKLRLTQVEKVSDQEEEF